MGLVEKDIETKFKKEVEKLGCMCIKFTPQGISGMPDRIVLLPGGRACFVELKAPGKKPRPLQEKRADQLMTLGFGVATIDSMDEIDKYVKLLKEYGSLKEWR